MATKDRAGSRPSASTESGGFLDKILSIFTGMGDPEAEKKKLIKSIAKDVTRSRFKFYRVKGSEATPALARFFYEIYKVVAPAQVLLTNASSSGVLRSFVIESFLSKEQRELAERITDAAIRERAQKLPLRELTESVRNDLLTFYSVFDADRTNQIDAAYSTLLSLVSFVNFDYYFLLKKFDSTLVERGFASKPNFDAISADYVADDLADFLEVFAPLNLEADWRRILGALKEYRNLDVISIESWNKLVPAIREVRQSQILEQVVRIAKRDPYFNSSPRVSGERIVEPFLDKLKNQVEMLIQQMSQERRNAKIEETAKAIFGTSVIVRTKNYTDKANIAFAKKMLGGYIHTGALNYLKAFLIDYFKKDIREINDILIIRGQWTINVQSQQLSDAYHGLLEVSDALLSFDDSLGEDTEIGARMRSALAKSERDKDAVKYLRQILKESNDKALAMLNKAALNLIAIGRQYRSLIEDFGKLRHEVLLNWKEIDSAAPKPVKDMLVEAYKKIYYMVQLLQYFVKGE